jgi:hypothetical protein
MKIGNLRKQIAFQSEQQTPDGARSAALIAGMTVGV